MGQSSIEVTYRSYGTPIKVGTFPPGALNFVGGFFDYRFSKAWLGGPELGDEAVQNPNVLVGQRELLTRFESFLQ